VSSFGENTGITNIRDHLAKYHITDWVKACDEMGITIGGSKAQIAVRKFRKLPGPTDLEAERPNFSKEAFVDALAEFVVADDQVCDIFNSKIVKLMYYISLSMLLNCLVSGRSSYCFGKS
jgi:hypothetical protein